MSCAKGKALYNSKNLSIIHFGCGHIGFRFKNMILNFQPDDFLEFCSSFQKVTFERRAITFPDRRKRMVINTCRQEIQLCFEYTEFKTVKNGLQEAALMLEVNQILSPERRN